MTKYFSLLLKGIAMGAADIVPGVSGGTIAFITGIYEEFIDSISSVNFNTIKIFRKDGIKATWNSINGNFLLSIFIGIGVSIFSLAKLISYLLENEKISLWSFFFGLVSISIYIVGKQVTSWKTSQILALFIGSVIAFYITILPPAAGANELWYLFISGMIAICAMILPGISGSFILLLLGSYATIIQAIKDKDLLILAVFASGCIVGLFSFSRLLKWLFSKYHDITIALLTGFLVGSLNKLWPWKENTILIHTHSDGSEDYLQENVLPNALDNQQISSAIIFFLLGIVLIFAIERISKFYEKSNR
jgi:putative membrane protein